MNRHISYPSIEQFRSVCKELAFKEGNDIKPVINFKGTVKLHGTNASVALDKKGMYVQSRSRVITPVCDNAGFASFVESKKEVFESLLKQVKSDHVVSDDDTIVIYGEWAGQGIQQGVGINNVPKSFFIFDILVTNESGQKWLDIQPYAVPEHNIYNIEHFNVWQMEIDFNNPELYQNDLADITYNVEAECPVTKSFGFSGIGEGVVWKAEYNGHRYIFKVKGEKHSSSKVKVLAKVDVEKINSVVAFAQYAVTESRLNQAIENVFNGEPLDIRKMGDVIRWVINDVHKEESDTLAENNLTDKDVNKIMSDYVRKMFTKTLESL